MISRSSSALSLPPLPCPSKTISFEARGVGQVRSPTDLNSFAHDRLRCLVSQLADAPPILVFQSCVTLFQLPDQHQSCLEQIDRFKTSDDNRHTEITDEALVLLASSDRADVSWRNEPL